MGKSRLQKPVRRAGENNTQTHPGPHAWGMTVS